MLGLVIDVLHKHSSVALKGKTYETPVAGALPSLNPLRVGLVRAMCVTAVMALRMPSSLVHHALDKALQISWLAEGCCVWDVMLDHVFASDPLTEKINVLKLSNLLVFCP